MTIHFDLAPVDKIAPWTTPSKGNHQSLHWFGLTDGYYWIEIGEHQLLRYSDAVCQHWATQYPDAELTPFVDYQVVRLWEDLLEMLPAILEPLPADLARRVSADGSWGTWKRLEKWRDQARAWFDTVGGDEWEHEYTATSWWGRRQLDSAYLRAGFGLWLWRIGDVVHVRWDNTDVLLDGIPAWSEVFGESSLSVLDFVATVRSFDARLIAAMNERVDQVSEHWNRLDVKINIEDLKREQRERATWLENALGKPVPMSEWDQARAAIARIEAGTT